MSDTHPNKVPANRMRLAEKVKKLRGSINIHLYKEYTEDKGQAVEVAEAEHNGQIVGRYVQKDGKVLETHASPDAQASGAHKDVAKAVGISEDEITHTSPAETVKVMEETADTRWGEGPQDLGAISDDQVDTPDDPETTQEADMSPGDSKDVKPKAPKSGKKPDNSMSRMSSIEPGEYEGGPDLTKSMTGSKALMLMRACRMRFEKLRKLEKNEESPGLKWLRANMKRKKAISGSTDEKINAALESQGRGKVNQYPGRGSTEEPAPKDKPPLIHPDHKNLRGLPSDHDKKTADLTGVPKESHVRVNKLLGDLANLREQGQSAQQTYAQAREDNELATRQQAKPIMIKEMKRHAKYTASGRPFRVLLGTHKDHRNMVGAHHVLEKPRTIKQVKNLLSNPASTINATMHDALRQGHDTLVIHQPESDFKTQKGPLKVIKSTSEKFEALRKNIMAGYPQLGIPPSNTGMAQMAMSEAPKTHEDHAKAAAQGVRDMLHARQNKTLQKDQPAQNNKVREVADQYAASKGMKLNHGLPKVQVDPAHATKIANAYQAMPHNPNDPQVKKAYNALVNETMDQFQHVKNSGLKMSRIEPGQASPYKNSKDVINDIHNNNHLWFYPTESGFGSGAGTENHPLLAPTQESVGGKPLLANDVFRIVHDYFGHAKEGHSFGPNGEENAWREHMQMYSPEAQKALTSETRMQNSWVNFGPHGEHNRQNPEKTVYADQKAGLPPEWIMNTGSAKK